MFIVVLNEKKKDKNQENEKIGCNDASKYDSAIQYIDLPAEDDAQYTALPTGADKNADDDDDNHYVMFDDVGEDDDDERPHYRSAMFDVTNATTNVYVTQQTVDVEKPIYDRNDLIFFFFFRKIIQI